ncbi:hypothetical protein GCM10027416_11830 [Okibacterium endophyticum]
MTFDRQQEAPHDAHVDRLPALERDEEHPTAAARVLSSLLSLVVGIAYGAIGTVAHVNTITVFGVEIPLGLVLAVAGAIALLLGFRLVLDDRFAVLCAAIGMVATVGLLSIESAGGTVLIPQGGPGLVWTLAPVLIGTVIVAWPALPPRRAQRPSPVATAEAGEASHED